MIFSLPEYVKTLQKEVRSLRIHNQLLQRSHLSQKGENTKLKEEIKRLKEEQKKLKQEKRRLEKEHEKLKREIEKITKTNNRYKVSLFDHGNFKQSTGCQKKKKRGGQVGHADTNRDSKREYASYERKRISASSCGNCGHELAHTNATKEKVLMDIQINTQILKLIVSSERQWCGNCHKETRAQHPQSLPFTEYGINTFMMIMIFRFKSHQSLGKISTVFEIAYGLNLPKSTIAHILMQAKEYLKEKYENLKQAIRDGSIMYNDETGWRVKDKSAWMWIMASEKQTIYVAGESRGKGIMEEMYGNAKSYSMHDGYGGYTNTVPKEKQLYCWAHILRFVHEETILSKKDSVEWHAKEELVVLYQTIRAHPEYTSEQKEFVLSEKIDELLAIPQENQTLKNILHRLETQRDGLIRSLIVTTDGTNNLAERELRPLAISRNISYGSDTYQGMETTAILASITQTIGRDKTQQFLPTLRDYFHKGIQQKYSQYKHAPTFTD